MDKGIRHISAIRGDKHWLKKTPAVTFLDIGGSLQGLICFVLTR